MSQSFKVKVNATYDFDISKDEINDLDVIEKSKNQYHILKKHQSYDAKVVTANFNKKEYEVTINGNRYLVGISDQLDALILDLGLGVSSAKKANDVKAPMPGLIVSVDISEGQEVKEGDGILVLEAMKMENTLTAPKDGRVKAIKVNAGDKVDKNALLIELE